MKRKRRFSFIGIFAVLFILAGLGAIIWHLMNNFQLNTYVNEQHGFKIGYPSDWDFQENINGAAVIFYSPLENQLDFFQDNINIVIQDISASPMGLEDYSNMAVEQMKMVFGENMKVQELSNTTIDGMPAKKFVFTGKGPQAELKYMSVWTIEGSTVYQLTYLAIASQYPNYLFKIHAMLNSFHRLSE